MVIQNVDIIHTNNVFGIVNVSGRMNVLTIVVLIKLVQIIQLNIMLVSPMNAVLNKGDYRVTGIIQYLRLGFTDKLVLNF